MKTVLLSSQRIGPARGNRLISTSNIDPDAPYCTFYFKGSSPTSGTSALSRTIQIKGPLLSNVREKSSSNRGTHFIIFFSLYLSLTRETYGGVLFINQDVLIVVRFEFPKNINVVHIVIVVHSSDFCVIFHSIRSNNMLD